VAVVVVMAAIALAVVVAMRGTDRATDTGDAVSQDRPGPVLLVPGYGGGTQELEVLATTLRATGREVVIVRTGGAADLREQAAALGRAADARLAAGAPSVDVIGYSSGGVVGRIWAAELGGADVARRIVTLGSPHHGTDIARLGAAIAPGACPEACRQLVPGSDLLADLAETVPGPVWTAVWTAQDAVVTPPESGILDGAVNVRVQDVCGDVRISHSQLPTDPLVVGLVALAVGVEPLDEVPDATRCDQIRAAGHQAGSRRASR
jgi:triacylglycerol lipase